MPDEYYFLSQEETEPVYHVRVMDSFKGDILDTALSMGFYRMRQYMFTCDSVAFQQDEPAHPVFWLRYLVDKMEISNTQRKLVKRISSTFQVQPAAPFIYSPVYEELYQRYRAAMNFDCADFLEETAGNPEMKFDSRVIEIRDKDRLVAAGIFDQGINSIAGIVNYYDPSYNRHSLGTVLLPLKYQYCQDNGIKYYYPGYISPTFPKFSYKTAIGAHVIEVYISSVDEWIPYSEFLKIFAIKA